MSSLTYLVDRIRNYTNDIPNDIKLFDIRILFLITALNTSARDVVKSDLCGDVCLIKIIKDFAAQERDSGTLKVM